MLTNPDVRRLLGLLGVPADKAQAAADAAVPRAGSAVEAVNESTARRVRAMGADVERQVLGRGRLEAAVQKDIRTALLAAGWKVWRVGQRNAKGTQDAGVPDLICIHPHRDHLAFVECKREVGGVQSEQQKDFESAVKAIVGFEGPVIEYRLASSIGDVQDLLTY